MKYSRVLHLKLSTSWTCNFISSSVKPFYFVDMKYSRALQLKCSTLWSCIVIELSSLTFPLRKSLEFSDNSFSTLRALYFVLIRYYTFSTPWTWNLLESFKLTFPTLCNMAFLMAFWLNFLHFVYTKFIRANVFKLVDMKVY